jgi:hypothetical protein
MIIFSLLCHVLGTGVDAMATKEVKNCMIFEIYPKRKLRASDPTQQKNCVKTSTFHRPKMLNDNHHIPRARQPFLPIKNNHDLTTVIIHIKIQNPFYVEKKTWPLETLIF